MIEIFGWVVVRHRRFLTLYLLLSLGDLVTTAIALSTNAAAVGELNPLTSLVFALAGVPGQIVLKLVGLPFIFLVFAGVDVLEEIEFFWRGSTTFLAVGLSLIGLAAVVLNLATLALLFGYWPT
jgi:hypothetical protein